MNCVSDSVFATVMLFQLMAWNYINFSCHQCLSPLLTGQLCVHLDVISRCGMISTIETNKVASTENLKQA